MSNKHNRYIGNSADKFEKQFDKYPSQAQKTYYEELYQQCSRYGEVKGLGKPSTRSEYKFAIEYLKAFLKERRKKG